MSKSAIYRRVARGLLHRVHRGVYLVGHTLWLPGARELAAVLACGPADALVSHGSALALRGVVLADARGPVHVTVPGRRLRRRPGIVVHRAPSLRGERMQVDGTPTTSVTRALLDIAAEGHPQLEAAVSEVQARRLVTQRQLRRYVEAATGRRGVDRLRAAVGAHETGFTRSEGERVMRRLCRAARLPQPQTNVPFQDYEIDFLWAEQRLVVEVDGYGAHSSRYAFERDRRKQMALVAAGFTVIRVTWHQLCEEAIMVASTIARALGRRDPRGY